jgi:hypothetical protein
MYPSSHPAASETLDLTRYVDDLAGRSYTAWNAFTKQRSYQLGYAVFVAAVSIILYGIHLVVKLTGMNLSAKVQELVTAAVGVLQFSLGVLIAIEQSRLVDPNGPNATTFEKLGKAMSMQMFTRPPSISSSPIPSSSGSSVFPAPTSSPIFTHSPLLSPPRPRPANSDSDNDHSPYHLSHYTSKQQEGLKWDFSIFYFCN